MKLLKIPNTAFIDIDFFDNQLYYVLTGIVNDKYDSIITGPIEQPFPVGTYHPPITYTDNITSHGFGRIKYPYILYRKDSAIPNNENGKLFHLQGMVPVDVGRIWGSWAMCFDVERTRAYYQQWTNEHGGEIFYRRLDLPHDGITTQQLAFATGLDRVQDGDIISWHDNRFTEPGMQAPQRTKDYIAGEVENGIAVNRKSDNSLHIFLKEMNELHDIHVAQNGNKLYVAFWQKTGPTRADSYILELEPADFVIVPIPLPVAKPITPFTNKRWMGVFHEFTDFAGNITEQEQPLGNCLIVTNGNLDKAAEELTAIFCTRSNYAPKHEGFIVGYYESAGSITDLATNVEVLRKDVYQTKILPEKPVIVVLDVAENSDSYPTNMPSWLDKDIHWLGVELYRGRAESIPAMHARLDRLFVKVNSWNIHKILISQFYQRAWKNPDESIMFDTKQHVMEAMEVAATYYGKLGQIGIFPFTRLRRGGIKDNLEFVPFVDEIRKAIVLGRPTRHFYWVSKNDWRRNLLKTIETHGLPINDQEEKYLISLIKNNLGV